MLNFFLVDVPHKLIKITISVVKMQVIDVNVAIYKSFGENTDQINK